MEKQQSQKILFNNFDYFNYDLSEHRATLLKKDWDRKNVRGFCNSGEAFDQLMTVGGFPEPFLKGEEVFYNRWKKNHLEIILRQDLLDLEKSPKTVKRWLHILENLYIIYKVTPYHQNIARALLKEPKYYFYDTGQVKGDDGAKLENIVANALIKEMHFLEDTLGYTMILHYLRDKDGKEIDFLVLNNTTPSHMIEIKWTADDPSPNFKHFSKCYLKTALYKKRMV